MSPSPTILGTGIRCAWSVTSIFLRPRSMAMAVAIIMMANPISRTLPGMNRASRPPPYAPAMPAAPKIRPVRHCTLPARACEIAPIALVTPTTNSEVAMACLASIPAT